MYSADSPGRSTLKTEALLIFDLDGTILSVNSFPYWVRYMLAGRFGGLKKSERLTLSLRTGYILIQRKLFRQSHYSAKRSLQALWTRSLARDRSQLAIHGLNARLKTYIRPNLQGLMTAVAGRHVDALLATSAAAEYAQGLGNAMGFTYILATPPCTEPDQVENRAERKRDRVLSLLKTQGWNNRQRIFFTDHVEDAPLMGECQRTLWFGRDEDVPAMQASIPQSEIIACRHLSDIDILRLVTSYAGA
jgi:phosphoserine phosphatase